MSNPGLCGQLCSGLRPFLRNCVGSTRCSPGISGPVMVQSPAPSRILNMITPLRSRLLLLLLVMVVVTQGARGQEQPGTAEDGPVNCEEDRDCLSPGEMCCFDLSNLTLASASKVDIYICLQ